jgi:hypothetical protein
VTDHVPPPAPEQVLRARLDGLAAAMGRTLDRDAGAGAEVLALPAPRGPRRERPGWVRPLAAAAAVAAIVGGAAALQAGDDDKPATIDTLDPRPTTTTSTTPLPEGMTEEQRDFIDKINGNEPQRIVDAKGRFRGTVLPTQLDDQVDAVRDRIARRQGTTGSTPGTTAVPTDVLEAYQVLEAIEVLDADGEVTGYWAGVFISEHDYPKAVRDAEKLTGERADN